MKEAGHYSGSHPEAGVPEVSRVHPMFTDPLFSVNHRELTPWRISKGRKLRLIFNKLKICHRKQYKGMHVTIQDRK